MKNVYKIGLVILIMTLLVFLSVKLASEWNKKRMQASNHEYLPSCRFINTSGIAVYLDSLVYDKSMLVIFDPACEHCIAEIGEIIGHLNELAKVEIIMVSTAPQNDIISFASAHGLDSIPQINIFQCDPGVFNRTFGNTPVPAIFIYGTDKKLRKIFKGEVKIEALLSVLKSI